MEKPYLLRPNPYSLLHQLIDLRRQNEIILVESADGVRPQFKIHHIVVDGEIRMMPLGLGNLFHLSQERHGAPKIMEGKPLSELLHFRSIFKNSSNLPAGHLGQERLNFFVACRRRIAFARHAVFCGEAKESHCAPW